MRALILRIGVRHFGKANIFYCCFHLHHAGIVLANITIGENVYSNHSTEITLDSIYASNRDHL